MIAPGAAPADVTQFVPAVREAGTAEQRARFLGAVADGTCSGTLAIAEHSRFVRPGPRRGHRDARRRRRGVAQARSASSSKATRSTRSSSWRASRERRVTTACARSWCRSTRRVHAPVHALDGSRRLAHVDLDGVRVVRVTACSATAPSAATALRRAIEEATVATALEIVGTSQTIFDVTLEYAKQREQFGVPIGSFQAIKHKFADMMVAARTGPGDRLLRGAHDRRRRRAAHDGNVGGEGCGRRLPAPARQRGHPDPRRHRLHVGTRHAPLREARQVAGAAVRFEQHPPRPHRRPARRLNRASLTCARARLRRS